jgi:hypothetical protein
VNSDEQITQFGQQLDAIGVRSRKQMHPLAFGQLDRLAAGREQSPAELTEMDQSAP